MFKIRLLTDDDYPTLSEWWVAGKFPVPPKDYLPEDGKGGLMVYKDDVEICAGYLFFTNSKIAWSEFIVANNMYREKDRKEAIRFLIREIANIFREKGFKLIFTSIKHPSLINHHLECGYVIGSENTKELIMHL